VQPPEDESMLSGAMPAIETVRRGTAAAPGIAIGRVYLVDRRRLKVPKRHLNEDEVDIWFGDVSLKAHALRSERFDLYAVAGPGLIQVESEDPEATVHLGVGLEIGLSERSYLRPEVRGRWLTDELHFDEGVVDYSVGFGWRF
jgi:hypothetical protein